jgi:peptide/nickel transport system substrate-binding protein
MAIISPTALRQHGQEWFDRHGIGTGLFRLADWVRNDRIVLVANDQYWGGRPPLDRVVLRTSGGIVKAVDLLSRDQADIAIDPGAEVTRFGGRPELVVKARPSLSTWCLAMNTRHLPFSDARVRQAILLALDVPAIAKFAFGRWAVPARS